MLHLIWKVSEDLNNYMRFYMPTNRAISWLRTPHGLKWAIPIGIVGTSSYLFAMTVCVVSIERGGPGYLNVMLMLCAWNAIKFGAMAAVCPFLYIRHRLCGRTR